MAISQKGRAIPVGVNRFVQPIPAANVVTAPDIEIVPAPAVITEELIIGNIAAASPDDDGMNTVSNAITKKIIAIAPTAGTIFNTPPSPSAILEFKPESINVIDKPLATETMNTTGTKSLQP
ncbi:MAG: hypothetical protein MJ219_02390 [Mycoplasmoidaceae bacterium]|nr:hypothetical protein [Mycoplasmoidaceae bacterium]